jgi:hypothetical protein
VQQGTSVASVVCGVDPGLSYDKVGADGRVMLVGLLCLLCHPVLCYAANPVCATVSAEQPELSIHGNHAVPCCVVLCGMSNMRCCVC